MPAPLSGPGVGLPLPQSLYPSQLQNAPADTSTNRVTLAPGETFNIPAGTWYLSPGDYLQLQFQDPVLSGGSQQVWVDTPTAGWQSGPIYVKSDGFNYRLANLTGCPVSATITSAGASYVQTSTSIAVTGHNSTWLPIVGGQLATLSFVANGAGYGLPPIAIIPAPPGPTSNVNGVGGIVASGYCTIANGTVSGFTFTNLGAGYPAAPNVQIVPSPLDPNLSTGITNASITFTTTGSGSLCGVICTNNGSALPNGSLANLTLTVSGAGVTATVVPNVLQTVVSASATVTAPSGILGANVGVLTVGGGPSAGTIAATPLGLRLAFRPRSANIVLATGAAGSVTAGTTGTIYDGGLFMQPPSAVVVGNLAVGVGSVSAFALALTMGGVPDVAILQPAP